MEGKTNGTGIKYDMEANIFKWNGLNVKVMVDLDNDYEVNALRNRICFRRIKRKFVGGKYKYILQIVLDGPIPVKVNKETGEVKNDIGVGTCGVDIGTQTIAFSSNYDVKIIRASTKNTKY